MSLLYYRKTYYAKHPTILWKHVIKWRIQGFWQRGQRGWSDRDVWNMEAHLARIIIGMIGRLREHGCTWPGEPMTITEWSGEDGILAKIAEGFQAHLDLFELYGDDYETQWPPLQSKFEDGMKLFVKWYDHLWD